MGKYEIQFWWADQRKWFPVKRFIFQWRALKYISKRVVNETYARKWRILDTSYAKPITQIVCKVERKK